MSLEDILRLWGVERGTTLELVRHEAVPVSSIDRLIVAVETMRRALPPLLVPVKEAATAMGLSERTAWRRVRDGSWPVRRDGRRVLVDLLRLHGPSEADVQAAVERVSRTKLSG